MNKTVILAVVGFGFCIAAAVKVLPSGDMVALMTDENVFGFFGEFLAAFIKQPFAWVGIGILLVAFREPVFSRNAEAHKHLKRSKSKS